MSALYNEFDPKAAAWLRWLIDEGLIPPGDVDERSIELVQPGDLDGYTHVHLFAGIGGWAYASLLAGWPADRPLWTGSCPCQPFSVAGKGLGADDPRHLWPHFFRLIRACRPPVVVGEQVAGEDGYGWFDGVAADLAGEHYACRAVDIPAAAVDSPQIRQRLYWVALADADRPGAHAAPHPGLHRGKEGDGPRHVDPSGLHGGSTVALGGAQPGRRDGTGLAAVKGAPLSVPSGTDGRGPISTQGDSEGVERGAGLRQGDPISHGVEPSDADGVGEALGLTEGGRLAVGEIDGRRGGTSARRVDVAGTDDRSNGTFWSDADWIQCHDGKARRVADAGTPLLAHGIPGRVVAWRGFGNAIVPQVAAEVLTTLMETT